MTATAAAMADRTTDGALVLSVNIGSPEANPHKNTGRTGIDKQPQEDPVAVRDPGPKHGGLGSGLVGDFIGDTRHHGGTEQAVYAFAREDLDSWSRRLDRQLRNGFFGENLTTTGIDVNDARIGERWRVGSTVELVVTSPRIPCATFRGWVDEPRWAKIFTEIARPGCYLRIAVPGELRSGDRLRVLDRPAHAVSVSLVYRALMGESQLLPSLLAAGEALPAETRDAVRRYSERNDG